MLLCYGSTGAFIREELFQDVSVFNQNLDFLFVFKFYFVFFFFSDLELSGSNGKLFLFGLGCIATIFMFGCSLQSYSISACHDTGVFSFLSL